MALRMAKKPMTTPYHDLFLDINQPVTIVTPNRRLAASLKQHYERNNCQKQQAAWLTPDILPLSTWIERLWQNVSFPVQEKMPILLNASQEEAIWVQIINHTRPLDAAIQVAEIATLMQTAWRLLKQWLISPDTPSAWAEEDYHSWACQFQQYCTRHNVVDNATLPDLLMKHFSQNNAMLEQKIISVGFTEYTPQVNALLGYFAHTIFHPASSCHPERSLCHPECSEGSPAKPQAFA